MAAESQRHAEHQKYLNAYQADHYSMGARRKADAERDLETFGQHAGWGAFLDVTCGRGEMLAYAEQLPFTYVHGTEIVPALIDGVRVERAEVHDLPFDDGRFAVVSMFDVIEHLVPGDDALACAELARVSSDVVLLTANNKPSRNHLGEDLHINIREYVEWHRCFQRWFPGYVVTRLDNGNSVSARWCMRRR